MEIVALSKINFRKNYPRHSPFFQFKSSFQDQKQINFQIYLQRQSLKRNVFLTLLQVSGSSCNATYYGKTKHHFKVCV